MGTPEFDLDKYKSISFVGVRLRGDRATFQREWEKKNNSELDSYQSLRQEGVQPKGTYRQHTEHAKKMSDKLGVPYRADDKTGTFERAGILEKREWTEVEKNQINPGRNSEVGDS